MDGLRHDLRFAIRSLGRNKGLTAVAAVTLALGIGASTSIFSVVSAVLLRPLPYDDEGRIVMVWEKRPRESAPANPVSPADFLDWRALSSAFENVAAFNGSSADLIGDGDPERIETGVVSWAFFDVLGVRPRLGRVFRAEDETAEGSNVAVLSHGLWQRRFGAAEDVVGRRINLGGKPHAVVGVLPEGFVFPLEDVEMWVPFHIPQGLALARAAHFLAVVARLKPGWSLDQARADMERLGARLEKDHPRDNTGHFPNVVPIRESLTRRSRDALLILLGAVALVLLIACANVANLLLARGLGRGKEMAIRTALGAGRGRLVRLLLTESVLLAALAGGLGLMVAFWGTGALASLVPSNFTGGFRDFEPDARVLVFTAALSVLTGLLFGIAPALQASSQLDLSRSLKEGGPVAVPGGRRWVRAALLVAQIGLALVLSIGSGLLVRSFLEVQQVAPGFRQPASILTAQLIVPRNRYPQDTQVVGFFDAVLARIGALPGVEAAGAISQLPLSGQDNRSGIEVEGRADSSDSSVPTRAHDRVVEGDYFRAMGVSLLSGRLADRRDGAGAPPVVVVNRAMSRRYWPEQDPVGRRVRLGGTTEWREVVGVVEDVTHWGLDGEVRPEMYVPLAQRPTPFLNLVVRGRTPPRELVAAVRDEVRSLDPDLPLSAVRTLQDVVDASLAPRRFFTVLLGSFAALALGLACVGTYSVFAFTVARRAREIGIRMAMGAQARQILGLVLGQGLRLALAGVAVGVTGALVLTRFLRTAVFGVGVGDPATYAGVTAVVVLVALAACWIPARRATRVEPMAALRDE